ncbi:MAG: hypothetical protein PHE93_03105 [Clostridia bacterium]|nr:hypothetical protein [Clostridia bacterium]
MRKNIALVLCLSLIASLALCFVGCSSNDNYQINSALLNDTSYIDYAENVFLNTEKYEELCDQGLGIVSGYDDQGVPIEVAADNKNNLINYFDSTLPSLIIVHGVQLGNGRYGTVYFDTENQGATEEMGNYFFSGDNSENQKWNLFYFHYERFADAEDGIGFNGASSMDATSVENRIWTRGADGLGSKFIQTDGTYSDADALEYSVAELFAAEYIRTMNQICELYPDFESNHNEIRTASHSMGGALTVASVSLLNILARDGQIGSDLLPNRMALLDSYVGGGKSEVPIAWSGKGYINGSGRSNYYYSLENIVLGAGIAVEFYYNQDGWVPFMGQLELTKQEQDDALVYYDEIKELTTMILLYPDYTNVNSVATDGHNAIREWYFTSYKYQTPQYFGSDDFVYEFEIYNEGTAEEEIYTYSYGGLKEGAVALGFAPSASASTQTIRELRGKCFEMKKTWDDNSKATVACDDDIIVTK